MGPDESVFGEDWRAGGKISLGMREWFFLPRIFPDGAAGSLDCLDED